MATRRPASCATGCSSPRPRRSASAGSSIGPGFRPRRSPIVSPRPGSGCAMSMPSRSTRTAAPIWGASSPIWRGGGRMPAWCWRLRNRRRRAGIAERLDRLSPADRFRGVVEPVEHHLAHLYSAYYVSPFAEAAVVSVDGFGDFSSAAWGRGGPSGIAVDGRVYFPHSLGIFYEALTQYLGFPYYGDEYKVMGLAPYGRPACLDKMRRIVRLRPGGGFALDLDYFRHHLEDVSYQWEDCAPMAGDLFSPALEDLLGPRRRPDEPLEDRHRDIARSVQ